MRASVAVWRAQSPLGGSRPLSAVPQTCGHVDSRGCKKYDVCSVCLTLRSRRPYTQRKDQYGYRGFTLMRPLLLPQSACLRRSPHSPQVSGRTGGRARCTNVTAVTQRRHAVITHSTEHCRASKEATASCPPHPRRTHAGRVPSRSTAV
eukprot:5572200-Prymnesium_polylepis.1